MKRPQKVVKSIRHLNDRLRDTRKSPPLIGYMRVSKADGSQVLDLQRDALIAAGVTERHIYSDTASGTKDDRPGLAACLQSLREGDTLVVWKLDGSGAISATWSTPCMTSRRRNRLRVSPARARRSTRRRRRQTRLRHLRRTRRVRARAHHRAHERRPCVRPRARTRRRSQAKDDGGEAPACDGEHGQA